MLEKILARKWPDVYPNAVDPGWVATKMGGAGGSDDLAQGYQIQVWLAVSDDAKAKVSGQYFYHQKTARYNPAADDLKLQDQLIDNCRRLTGVDLFKSPA